MAEADGYRDYRQAHGFNHYPGTVIAPSSNRSGAARVLRVAGAYGTRVVTFDASRTGLPPVVPAPEDTDGDLYVGGTVNLPLPTINARTSTFVFSAAGQYTYLQSPVRVPGTDPMPTGSYPWQMIQDVASYVALRNQDGFSAAMASATPSKDLLAIADPLFDPTDATTPWSLTGFPTGAFSVDTISG